MISTDGQAYVKLHRLSRAVSTLENGALYMRCGTVQVKKSAADDLRVCSEKSPNIAFDRDVANSAAPLNLLKVYRLITFKKQFLLCLFKAA
jgi:hypothetical protein